MSAIVPVVIVGAGPTGVAAATALAQHAVRSLLFERYPQQYALPRAVHLDDEVMRILQQLGVAEGFAAISRPARGLRLLDAGHRVIAEFRRDLRQGVHGHPQANLFDQPDLERLLRHNLAGYQQVELRSGVEVIGLAPGPPCADPGEPAPTRVTFRNLGDGVEGSILARAVLGCDGANSAVRGFIGARLEDLGFEQRWLVLDVRTAARFPAWDGVEQVCDPARAATFMRIGPQRYRWEFRLLTGESAPMLTTPERLRALLAPWIELGPDGALQDSRFEVLRAAEYTFRARLADRWRSGRVFLLGDAAHLTPPFVGQGLGSGLRDAQNLAWKLARVLTQDADERILDTYQAERKPHARAMIRLAVLAGWAMTGGQDRAAVLRRAVLRVGCRVPGVTGLILNSTSPRLTTGPLVRRLPPSARLRRPRPDLAGTLCPQPWVRVLSGRPDLDRQRLDDVLGGSFALLVDGPVSAEGAVAAGLAESLGARLIQLSDHPADPDPDSPADPDTDSLEDAAGKDVVLIDAPDLRRWMRRSRVCAVLVRPDRVVLATAAARRALDVEPPIWWLGRLSGPLARPKSTPS